MKHDEVERIHKEEKRALTVEECRKIIHQRKSFGDIKENSVTDK